MPSFLNKIGRIYGQLKVNYEYFFRSLRKTEYDIKEHLQESLSFKEQTKPAIKEKQTKKKQTLSNKTQTKKKNKQKKNLKDLN